MVSQKKFLVILILYELQKQHTVKAVLEIGWQLYTSILKKNYFLLLLLIMDRPSYSKGTELSESKNN